MPSHGLGDRVRAVMDAELNLGALNGCAEYAEYNEPRLSRTGALDHPTAPREPTRIRLRDLTRKIGQIRRWPGGLSEG